MDWHFVCGHQGLRYAEGKDVLATVYFSHALQETVMSYVCADGHMCNCTRGQDGLSIRHASANVQRGVFLCPGDSATRPELWTGPPAKGASCLGPP